MIQTKNSLGQLLTGSLLWLSIEMAACFWLVASTIDSLLMEGSSYFENLVPQEPRELWMRVAVIFLFICFGIVAQYAIDMRRRSENDLRLSATVFESADDGIFITDAESVIIDVNQAFERITGYGRKFVVGEKPSMFQSGQHGEDFYQSMWVDLATRGSWEGEIWDLRRDGTRYPTWMTISTVRDQAGEVGHYVGIFRDMTNLKEAEERLTYLAHYDPLTGLVNRTLMDDLLQKALKFAKRNNWGVVLMFIDVDQFKDVNDTLGHDIGDKMLIEAAKRLRRAVRESDTVARLGGDEFVIMLENLSGEIEISTVAAKLQAAFEAPFSLADHELFLTISIGITVYPYDGTTGGELMKNADIAMYHAKGEGRNNHQFYSSTMNETSHKRLKLVSELHRALEDDQFVLYYQPQYGIESGSISGAEALIRWEHPERGLVGPNEFIPVAESTGLIDVMGEWVMWEACRQYRSWQYAGCHIPQIAVNLTARQFRQPGLVRKIEYILNKTGVEPENLELEITETMLLQTENKLLYLMNELHELGVKFALDDFGTGYSSLSYLKHYPIDFVKVDRSFVQDITTNTDDAAIIKAIIFMAHSLNMRVIAEGVETAEQLEFLKEQQCDSVQGYYYSMPRAPCELESLLSKQGHWPQAVVDRLIKGRRTA